MATWLAYLKSNLLPEEDDDDFKALEVAEKLKYNKKLELIRILSDQMLQKRLGVHIFTRGKRWNKVDKHACI